MPVTVKVENVAPGICEDKGRRPSAETLLRGTAPEEFNRSKQVIQTSFDERFLASNRLQPSKNGLVYTIFSAWCHHYHLTLRPEDLWFAILSQLNFYINAHAEELRSFFVAHEGQKELEVGDAGNIETVDLGQLAYELTREIEKNILDPELRTWVMPEFSTTTQSDRIVAAVLMMGAMQKYFTYLMTLGCGLPSVTLLGERRDWEMLYEKIDKIPQLGREPEHFAHLLKAVVQRFLQSFDDPEDPEIKDFWRKCAHQNGGSGPRYLSGWVTAFCFWNEDGKCLYREPGLSRDPSRPGVDGCDLDGTLFHRVETDDIPVGYALVPVTVDDNGTIYKTKMLSGSVAIQTTSSDPEQRTPVGNRPCFDTIRPVSGWWMYEILSDDEVEEQEKEAARIEDERRKLYLQKANAHGLERKRPTYLSRAAAKLRGFLA